MSEHLKRYKMDCFDSIVPSDEGDLCDYDEAMELITAIRTRCDALEAENQKLWGWLDSLSCKTREFKALLRKN